MWCCRRFPKVRPYRCCGDDDDDRSERPYPTREYYWGGSRYVKTQQPGCDHLTQTVLRVVRPLKLYSCHTLGLLRIWGFVSLWFIYFVNHAASLDATDITILDFRDVGHIRRLRRLGEHGRPRLGIPVPTCYGRCRFS